ncbi:All-trans-phytoene synthase/15-cis-phytoene synthase [Halomonas sp. THAF5a]|uniref:phytoene/squalene synthase family protein n=1 Tax=Halomonas sp. THAF5a TaxID=2587844 RepID=UPI001267F82F|nr:phytoene/squalene synthase family protein [Halomonas sp. THAF5a]QFU02001.1 All-trans-phytoene synthase/15-cis-phytoene synthase [Halomonas sp. THAF5a]
MARVLGTATDNAEADAYQDRVLGGVSRTFALTIPQLPAELRQAVTNAYLLCRIADTLEDEPALSAGQKRHLQERFLAVLRVEEAAEDFARQVTPLLSPATTPEERALMANTPRVVRCTHGLAPPQRQALIQCVSIMCRGMGHYQANASREGLADLGEVDRYCYHVAGVVGEMLTELFCQYSDDMHERRGEMLALAPSFGQGLQLTNILKDLWDDRQRGVCWLPRQEFQAFGVDVASLAPGRDDPAFVAALGHMVGVAHAHLRNALRYTLMVPAREAGIRRFCLWAIGLALLTLRRIAARPTYGTGRQVKVPRRTVRVAIATTRLTARHDGLLTLLFNGVARGLPLVPLAGPDPALSAWALGPSEGSGARASRAGLGLGNDTQ